MELIRTEIYGYTMTDNEEKRERFLRASQRRVNSVLERIRVLGKCANIQYYSYDEAQVRKMFRAIDDELRRVKGLFTKKSESEFQWTEK